MRPVSLRRTRSTKDQIERQTRNQRTERGRDLPVWVKCICGKGKWIYRKDVETWTCSARCRMYQWRTLNGKVKWARLILDGQSRQE
jgi:hypothetical protein